LSEREALTRRLRAEAHGFSTEGLDLPFNFILRGIANEWHVPPPFMREWFSYEDIERELQTRQILAEAQSRGRPST
jgi:hypothetical protein